MKAKIEEHILQECRKLISRYHLKFEEARKDRARFRKRTGLPPKRKRSHEPKHWRLDPHFNPFKVRQRATVLAYTIAAKLRANTYRPKPALVLEIPKPHGGKRSISICPVPDSAVSSYLYETVLKRNQHLFSSYAYAYRRDRLPHHAVEYLLKFAITRPRLYLLEYDFANYFDNISHGYVLQVLETFFRISPREKHLIALFLKLNRARGVDNYRKKDFDSPNIGTPQGTSISLFLANVACFELDQQLEREGAVFARYADDLIVLCDDYNKAHRCASHVLEHEKRCHTSVNLQKSPGISLFTLEKEPEMKHKSQFDFLGYAFKRVLLTRNNRRLLTVQLSVGDRAIKKIKRKLSSILFRHLLLYPKRGQFSAKRITSGGVDWDMVTCINELRHYIYGSLSEKNMQLSLSDKRSKLHFTRSVMSYYPLVDNPDIFRELDGWLVGAIQATQAERARTIKETCPSYRVYAERELLAGSWYTELLPNEPLIPSFFKSWLYVRKLLHVCDLSRFPSAQYGY